MSAEDKKKRGIVARTKRESEIEKKFWHHIRRRGSSRGIVGIVSWNLRERSSSAPRPSDPNHRTGKYKHQARFL